MLFWEPDSAICSWYITRVMWFFIYHFTSLKISFFVLLMFCLMFLIDTYYLSKLHLLPKSVDQSEQVCKWCITPHVWEVQIWIWSKLRGKSSALVCQQNRVIYSPNSKKKVCLWHHDHGNTAPLALTHLSAVITSATVWQLSKNKCASDVTQFLAWRQPHWPSSCKNDVMNAHRCTCPGSKPNVSGWHFLYRLPTLKGPHSQSIHVTSMKLSQNTDRGVLPTSINFLFTENQNVLSILMFFNRMSISLNSELQRTLAWYTGCISPKCHYPIEVLQKVYIT